MTTENRNILLGSIALIIIIVGIIFVGKHKAAAPGNQEQEALQEATKDWETWESGTYNSDVDESTMYTVSHPKDFVVSKRATAKGGFLKNPLVTMAFPKGAFAEPKSTYSEAYATVSSSKSKNTEERCFTIPGEATGEFTDVTTWNDLKVKRVDASDPGAGNLYTSRIYRTLFDGTCYEIALTVHTTNIDNYETGTVVEFDKEQAFSVLENIRMTFGLRKEAGPLK